MGSREKLRKELLRFPQGISESELVRRTNLSKTTVNENIRSLETQGLAFKQRHLWFPEEPSDFRQASSPLLPRNELPFKVVVLAPKPSRAEWKENQRHKEIYDLMYQDLLLHEEMGFPETELKRKERRLKEYAKLYKLF